MNRRTLLAGGSAVIVVGATGLGYALSRDDAAAVPSGGFEVTHTPAEWRARLTEAEYRVLREAGTEPAGSSPLATEHRAGTYQCAGCDLAVYDAATKFESGTGWPSFTASLADAVGTRQDDSFFATRTEVHCRRCGGHLGHIFDDGPAPTGMRHCLNGVALRFVAA